MTSLMTLHGANLGTSLLQLLLLALGMAMYVSYASTKGCLGGCAPTDHKLDVRMVVP